MGTYVDPTTGEQYQTAVNPQTGHVQITSGQNTSFDLTANPQGPGMTESGIPSANYGDYLSDYMAGGQVTPKEGDLKYIANVLYKFTGGRWVAQQFNQPLAPTSALAASALLDQINGGNNMANTDIAGAYGPQTQYLRALGLGQGYQNPAQKYLANMYDQFRSIWGIQQPINTATGGTSQDWGQYIGNLGGGMQNVYSQAAATLAKLLGMSSADRSLAGFNFEPQYDPVTGETLTSSQTGELSTANLQNLLGQGTAQRFGPIGSHWLAGRIPQLQQQWQLGQAGGGAGQTFLDYLRQKYNL